MRGFTLLELLVVISILTLSFLIIPNISKGYKGFLLKDTARKYQNFFRFVRIFSLTAGLEVPVTVYPGCSKVEASLEKKIIKIEAPGLVYCTVNGKSLEKKFSFLVTPYGFPPNLVFTFHANGTTKTYKLTFSPHMFFPNLSGGSD